jgi:single-strand DNA-binding protein
MSDNDVTLTGNLTRSPELRFSNSGTAMTNLGIAVNNRRKQADGTYEDDPQFFDIQLFGSLAENVAGSLDKGNRVIVTGKLSYRTWESNGEKRSKVEVVADAVGPDLRWATASVTRTERPA